MPKNGRTIKEDASKAQAFINVFAESFANLHTSSTSSLGFIYNRTFLNYVTFHVILVYEKLRSLPLRNCNAPGYIHHHLLTKAAAVVASSISTVFSISLHE